MIQMHQEYDPEKLAEKINSVSEKNLWMSFRRKMETQRMQTHHPELVKARGSCSARGET